MMFKDKVIVIVSMLLLLALSGCTTSPSKSKPDGGITLQNVDSRTAYISHSYLSSQGGSTMLRGELMRNIPARGAIPGSLQVELINASGELIKERNIAYKRKNIRSQYAKFSLIIPDTTDSISTIRITHIDGRRDKGETAAWQSVSVEK